MGNVTNLEKDVNDKWVEKRHELIYIWSGANANAAPDAAAGNKIPMGSIGFDGDGASTGNVYVYDLDNDTWQDTSASVAQFFGA